MDIKIEELLPLGHANAISRRELRILANMSDRCLRKNIERARAKGILIGNFQDNNGYFLIETDEEKIIQFKINRARAMSILVQQKYLYKDVKDKIKWKEEVSNNGKATK